MEADYASFLLFRIRCLQPFDLADESISFRRRVGIGKSIGLGAAFLVKSPCIRWFDTTDGMLLASPTTITSSRTAHASPTKIAQRTLGQGGIS